MRIFIEPKGKRKLPRPKDMSKFYFKVKEVLRNGR
jgi:phage antirepressor YoqD-like protein